MYKNILLPTEGTEFCEKAVRHGIALAKLAGARVTGVTVTVPMRLPQSVPPDLAERLRESRRAEAQEILASVEATAKASGVQCETLVHSRREDGVSDEHFATGLTRRAG